MKQTRGTGDRRIGRPATVYCLSEAGDHLFPKHYDALAIVMIDAVAEKLGPEALTKVLESVADAKVSEIAPHLHGLPLSDKLAKLKSWYLPDDPFMTTEAGETGYRLVERNCPFLNTALRRPALCSVSVNALTKLLGVRVEREEKFQNGAGRCVFRVHPEQPVDPSTWRFALETANG